jgi:O-methyltransferase involved in polyketide biosynthesis
MYFEEEQMKNFFITLADYFGKCELYFDSLSPLGIKIGRKMVLKKGGMMMEGKGWGIKRPKSIQKWDKRFKVIKSHPISKGMTKGLPFKAKLMSFLVNDLMGVAKMVHLGIS